MIDASVLVVGEERTVAVEAVAEPPSERFDFALVTLKAAYHEAALAPLRETADAFVSLGTVSSRTGSRSSSAPTA